jgi:hypothetical protein
MIVSSQDKNWLNKSYPELQVVDQDGIFGVLKFTATYNGESGRFLILHENIIDNVGGLKLTGEFKIRIAERVNKSLSKLPALFIEEIEPEPARHFSKDYSACLCSPLEEEDFLQPEFSLQKFLEELVIPFLYGQIYYSKEQRWPWQDYHHGNLGLLQSYGKIDKQNNAELAREFLNYLKQDVNWPRLKNILTLTRPSKQPCLCGSTSKLRDCHPEILPGLSRLKADLSNFCIELD